MNGLSLLDLMDLSRDEPINFVSRDNVSMHFVHDKSEISEEIFEYVSKFSDADKYRLDRIRDIVSVKVGVSNKLLLSDYLSREICLFDEQYDFVSSDSQRVGVFELELLPYSGDLTSADYLEYNIRKRIINFGSFNRGLVDFDGSAACLSKSGFLTLKADEKNFSRMIGFLKDYNSTVNSDSFKSKLVDLKANLYDYEFKLFTDFFED